MVEHLEQLLTKSEQQMLLNNVEHVLDQYLYFKIVGFDDLSISGVVDDSVDARKAYCNVMEQAVATLPELEKQLITERYLTDDYVFDHHVYKQSMNINSQSFRKYRLLAMYKLATLLNIRGDIPSVDLPALNKRSKKFVSRINHGRR